MQRVLSVVAEDRPARGLAAAWSPESRRRFPAAPSPSGPGMAPLFAQAASADEESAPRLPEVVQYAIAALPSNGRIAEILRNRPEPSDDEVRRVRRMTYAVRGRLASPDQIRSN